MQRINLPKTGYSVSRICLGGNRFGGDLDQDKSFELLDAFVEIGGNFIDSAHVYANWIPGNEKSSSEKTIGRWLASRKPQGLVIATKGGHPIDGVKRLDLASLRTDASEACENLRVPTLDIFYVHRDDPSRPVAEILESLEILRKEGLFRHYAASNWHLERLIEAQEIAARMGIAGFVGNQCEWSLARRNPGSASSDLVAMGRDMVAFHARSGLAAIPYSAQAKGYFDKVAAGDPGVLTNAYGNAENRQISAVLSRLSSQYGATPTEIMLAAMLRAPFPVIPVIGPRNPDQLRSSVKCLTLDLADADVSALLDTK